MHIAFENQKSILYLSLSLYIYIYTYYVYSVNSCDMICVAEKVLISYIFK